MSLLLATTLFGTAAVFGLRNPERLGHENCPCILNNDLIPEGTQVKHNGYGTYCRSWDEELEYCSEQHNPSRPSGFNDGFDWCADKWCHIDSENCEGPVEVNGSSWSPSADEALFVGSVVWPEVKGLYYSYQTCGNEDRYENEDISWVWDFNACVPRTANDYYMLVDGSGSVRDEWEDVKLAMERIVTSGMNVEGDRVGLLEFSGKRSHSVEDVVEVFDFTATKEERISAIQSMEHLNGQTWTLYGLQRTIQKWNTETVIDDDDRKKVLLLVTDGRPKPRFPEEPGCVTDMQDTQLDVCGPGESGNCRYPHCSDVDMSTTDCCPGDQDPCTSDEKDALVQSLKDYNILLVVIAVGADASNIKTDDGEVLYFGCLITPDYDQSDVTADAVAHRISTISNFERFFEYKDPTAPEEGGNDGQLCIDPVVFFTPAPPTLACTEIPEPKSTVLLLDTSKSMYTTKTRGGTQAGNWLEVMQQLQAVVCLHDSFKEDDTCAYTLEDNVGLVVFASQVEEIFHLTEAHWFTNLRFTTEVGGKEVSAIDRQSRRFMTDTAAGLWMALDQMAEHPDEDVVLPDGSRVEQRREVVIITDGRPHCKRDEDTNCEPCAPAFRDETLQKLADARCEVKLIWRGDRETHDGTITVDVDFLRRDDVFGCLGIDFDSSEHFVTVEDFTDPSFVDALKGRKVCVQDQA